MRQIATVETVETQIPETEASALSPAQTAAIGLLAGGASITSAARELGLHRSTVHRWEHEPAFSDALDEAQWQLAAAQMQQLQEMAETHAKIAKLFLMRVIERLQNLDPAQLPVSALASWFDTAVRVERLSRGVETERTRQEVTGAKEGDPIKIEAVDYYAAIEALKPSSLRTDGTETEQPDDWMPGQGDGFDSDSDGERNDYDRGVSLDDNDPYEAEKEEERQEAEAETRGEWGSGHLTGRRAPRVDRDLYDTNL